MSCLKTPKLEGQSLLLVSGIGLYIVYYLEQYYSQRQEVCLLSLYKMHFTETPHIDRSRGCTCPLSGSNSSLNLGLDSDNNIGMQLLSLHNKPDTPCSTIFPQNKQRNLKAKAMLIQRA